MCKGEEREVGRLGDNVGDGIGIRVAAELRPLVKTASDNIDRLGSKVVEILEEARVEGIEGGITKADGQAIGGWWLRLGPRPAADQVGGEPADTP